MSSQNSRDPPLIFDIGAHEGQDTAYYLSRGAQVVAVDADERLINALSRRFRPEVAARRLQTVTRAVSDVADQTVSFFLNQNSGLNSLLSDITSRGSSPTQSVAQVQTTTLAALVEEFGIPDYCKIDVEGYDAIAVRSLANGPNPRFISAEVDSVPGDRAHATDEVLLALVARGYDRFKLVDQRTLRVLNAADTLYGDYDRFFPRTQFLLYRRLPGFVWSPYERERKRLNTRYGFKFPYSSTGPYGSDLAGDWVDADAAARIFERQRAAYFATRNPVPWGFWCDWHATSTTTNS